MRFLKIIVFLLMIVFTVSSALSLGTFKYGSNQGKPDLYKDFNGSDFCLSDGSNCALGNGSGGSGDITSVTVNSSYLVGGGVTGDVVIGFNDSLLNDTIDARDSDTTYTNGTGINLTNGVFSVLLSYYNDWNTAYSWGNHATQGYITDGNTGWGNSYGFIANGTDASLNNLTANNVSVIGDVLCLSNPCNLKGANGVSFIRVDYSSGTDLQYGDTKTTVTGAVIQWTVGGFEKGRISGNGVSILTTENTTALSVNGSINVSGGGRSIFVDGQTVCLSNGSNCLVGYNNSFNQSLTDTLYYPKNTNPSGYYNVTTLPAYPIADNTSWNQSYANTKYLKRNGDSASGNYTLGDATGALFVDETNGRIGIGTTAPKQALSVGGDTNITGNIYLPGNFTMYRDGTPFFAHPVASSFFLGRNAGNYSSTAIRNLGVGTGTLAKISTGSSNACIGASACPELTTGSTNLAMGQFALFVQDTASFNTAVGASAGANITSGGNNVCLGYASCYGGGSTGAVTTAGNTIFIGANAKFLNGTQYDASGCMGANCKIGKPSAFNFGFTSTGFNTAIPNDAATVHINDTLLLEPRASAPSSPTNGLLYYDSTGNDALCAYINGAWVVVAGAGACA